MTSTSAGPWHVSAELLAAYLERRLDPAERAAVDRHLAGCDACREDLAAAGRMLRRYRRPGRRAATAAAVGVAALLVLMVRAGDGGPGDLAAPDEPAAVELYRSGPTDAAARSAAVARNPVPGATVAAGEPLTFRWVPAGRDVMHRVVLADEAGRTLWLTETLDSTATLPGDVTLRAGAVYIWYVDVVDADGEAIGSRPVSFTVR